jgi:hypothetical protein
MNGEERNQRELEKKLYKVTEQKTGERLLSCLSLLIEK